MIIPKPGEDLKDWAEKLVAHLEQAEDVKLAVAQPGEIKMMATDQIPDGYLLCDGGEVLLADYPALGGLLEDIWGAPSSSEYFKLPNLIDRLLVGKAEADIANTEDVTNTAGLTAVGLVPVVKT